MGLAFQAIQRRERACRRRGRGAKSQERPLGGPGSDCALGIPKEGETEKAKSPGPTGRQDNLTEALKKHLARQAGDHGLWVLPNNPLKRGAVVVGHGVVERVASSLSFLTRSAFSASVSRPA